jgi:hypothetical protein
MMADGRNALINIAGEAQKRGEFTRDAKRLADLFILSNKIQSKIQKSGKCVLPS